MEESFQSKFEKDYQGEAFNITYKSLFHKQTGFCANHTTRTFVSLSELDEEGKELVNSIGVKINLFNGSSIKLIKSNLSIFTDAKEKIDKSSFFHDIQFVRFSSQQQVAQDKFDQYKNKLTEYLENLNNIIKKAQQPERKNWVANCCNYFSGRNKTQNSGGPSIG